MRRKRKTAEEFITEAKEKHGDKYDYSMVKINGNAHTKVKIKCNTCGCVFGQRIYSHLHGHGCPECAKHERAMTRRTTKYRFIVKAKEKHGDKYDYSLVSNIDNNLTKVKIKCNKCGTVFEQRIGDHLNGQGCPECAGNKRLTKEEFIAKARKVHGNKYNYALAEIAGNNKTKVKIKCNACGCVFEQKINNHLNGQGCPECAGNKRKTKEKFIEEAKTIHAGKYNYDKVEYVNNKTPVTITCPIHGDFTQTPHAHKQGQGCPNCSSSHLERQTATLLEQNNIKYESEKTFPWLKNKREMPLDFYLPEYNIAIECQGIQHYLTESNGYFKDEDIKSTQQNDKLKLSLCKEHRIPVYYIKYNDNVEESINNLLVYLKSYNNDR